MANSTTNLDLLSTQQAQKELTANGLFDAGSVATLFGRRQNECAGILWGYYGGPFVKSDGTLTNVSNNTLTLDASSTNYIVAKKEDGVVSFLTTTTNWNNTNDYWRLYSVVTDAVGVTSYSDVRQIGAMTGMRSGFVAPVTKATSFTIAANENEVICNGTATITVTLPSAASWAGRKVRIKTIAAYTVVSASSNVVPLAGGSAGTAILAATAGKWAELVSDGTNWIVMAAA